MPQPEDPDHPDVFDPHDDASAPGDGGPGESAAAATGEAATGGAAPEGLYEAFHDFLRRRGWQVAADPETGGLRWRFRGEHGEWGCLALVDEAAAQVIVYSIFLETPPEARRGALADLAARANFGLPWSCFEVGGEPLQVRCRTGVDVEGTAADPVLLRNLVLHNLTTFDRYLPAIRAVTDGGDPGDAVSRVELEAPAEGSGP